jgi:hypothetical protein
MDKMKRIEITLTKHIENMKLYPQGKSDLVDIAEISNFVDDGSIIITFANLNLDGEKNERLKTFFEEKSEQSIANYLTRVYVDIEKSYDNLIADMVMVDIINDFVNGKKQKDINRTKLLLVKQFNEICDMAETYAELAVRSTFMAREGNGMQLYALAFSLAGSLHGDVKYGVYPCFINGIVSLCDIFTITSSQAAFDFDLASIAKSQTTVKKCDNCGKYFIPSSRSDEIYCDNIYKKGKTCKELGYENKLEKDEALKVYRTAYKTQNARMQRNKNVHDYKGRFFDPWNEAAKDKIEWVHAGKMTIEDYKLWQVEAREKIEQARSGSLSLADYAEWLKK